MAEKATHTELPWEVDMNCAGELSVFPHDDATDYLKICTLSDRRSSGVTKANAEFIVKACNSHYDLLAACEAAWQEIDQTYDGTSPPQITVEIWQQIEAAIAKSKGD